ncbi:piezo-type mechanosensitive ion channel component 2-like isoform X5 [Stegodyphus dumicola]|uniref:piezo-type mechanosensitive ion channel component 2-like isoform X5 n=1 Tax=Stegodyphus dumicola TaxID=202533 RepID=UPI0015A75D5C|nr:piezo-type mechanosensitive ion channel component 2-like isoform X5 [Stegodyphus dumicola]
MLSIGNYGSFLNYCEWKGRLFAVFGFHRLDKVKALDAVRLIGLDFLVLFSSVAVFISCEKLQNAQQSPETQELADGDVSRKPVRRRKKRRSEVLYWTGEAFVLFFLASAGIMHPSLTSAVYFLTFLIVCTWLSCYKKIGRKYLQTKIPLLIYCAIHFVILYLYQVDYVQEFLPPESLTARLLGLPEFVEQNCTNDARTLVFHTQAWTVYASPFFILGLYCLLSLIIRKQLISPAVDESKYEPCMSRVDSKQSSQHSQGSVRRRKQSRRMTRGADEYDLYYKSFETTPLLDEDHTGRSYRTIDCSDAAAKETLAVDPNGSIIWTSESDMPEGLAEHTDEEKIITKGFGSKLKKVFAPILSALKLIARGSYVATLIVMMTWSITYHSWLTFVLLLWSCILWMCPNSRYACLRSSPALVVYAEALLLLQYIFGLNLNDDELPTFSKNVAQIGLVKYGDLTYQPLAIKMLYTVMFWITMRQYFEERQQSNQRDIAEGLMLEPFNISYNTANPACPRPSIKRHFSIVPSTTSPNPYIRLIAETVSNLLTKYWIWVVATMLMVISLGGQVVVVYRIVYMFLFLFFILMFQFSYQFWRRIMYSFWLTVIVFSMLVLILIYTYQFEDFDNYWEKYLHVPKSLQRDLGLELYDSDTGTLFLKLLTPTFFLIITIIQLHYFHKDFLLISDINYRSSENIADTTQLTTATDIPNDSGATHITIEPETAPERPKNLDITPEKEMPALPSSEAQTPSSPKKDDIDSNRAEREFRAVKVCLNNIFHEVQVVFTYISEILWRVLEIHIVKIVLLSTFCLAAYDVCAIHFAFVVFVVISLPIKSLQSFFCHCCSVWAAVLLLSKMIYQLNIVDYLNWQINCTNVAFTNSSNLPYPFNTTIDNHDWIGFKRTHYLADYCKGYIALILVLTVQAVVKIRQEVNRIHLNEPEPKTGVIFTNATRATADDNLLECLKYLANYFFYKFGLEFCFVTIVACIGVRLDVFAFLSAVWLSSMFLLKRKTLAKVWPFYVSYQCIVLTIQYLICLGLPPGLCMEYPWTEALVEGLREWLFLPDFQSPPNATKIVADFFQLLFACCQLFVFQIETSPISELYEGGNNKEINFDVPEPNPIPDFVTCTKTCLDMLKVFIFYAFYWISLAVVFQAGTSRINLFAMGYVVSCFYFLWNGNEFYLKSRPVLLRMWNILLAYNVAVILLSCVLQLIGCTYFEILREKQCWLVQLLGIACQRKLKGGADPNDEICQFESDPGLIYDIICFAFLLLQRRLFSSYYFQHVVNEVKAQQVLSSRGAELIHEIQMKEVQEQQANEKEIMERIKKKMDRIRAYQQKIRGGENMEPETHFQATDFCSYSTPMYSDATTPRTTAPEDRNPDTVTTPPQRPISPGSAFYTPSLDAYMEPKLNVGHSHTHHRAQSPIEEDSYPVFSPPPYPAALEALQYLPEYLLHCGYSSQLLARCYPNLLRFRRSRSSSAPSTHHASIRSGDYYMFDDFSDDDIDLELSARHKRGDEDDEDSAEVKEKGLNALLSKTIRGNLKLVDEPRKESGEVDDIEDSSQQSAIVSADRDGVASSSQKTSHKSPDPLTITSSGPTMSLSLPSSASSTSASSPKEDTIAPVSPQDVKLLEEDDIKEETFVEKIKRWYAFFCEFMNSVLISTTAKLNAVSKDYRFVARQLSKEKKLLKERFIHNGSFDMDEAESEMKSREVETLPGSSKDLKQVAVVMKKTNLDFLESCELISSQDALEKGSKKQHSAFVRFLVALYYAAISRSELLCYMVIIVNQMKSASILSLPLPLFAFLWGTLSVPRPTKAFWITIITYTEAIVVLKYLFQFYFFPWNNSEPPPNNPFYPTVILGIRKDDNYAGYDLAVLLVVFFHRFMLKSLGLWKDTEKSLIIPKVETPSAPPEKVVMNGKDGELVKKLTNIPEISKDVLQSGDDKLIDSADECSDDASSESSFYEDFQRVDINKIVGTVVDPVKMFFYHLLYPEYRVTVDVYAFMFFCDFINFFIVVFGYWAFGTEGSEAVTSYFEENKVPIPFLIMLIAQFATIVTDRALYLRKYILGKLIFQIISVFVVHMWMFFILPAITSRDFVASNNLPPKMWYFIKCIYLLLSAHQIRSGYPTRILGNFFCKKYNYANLFLFKGYMIIPFLYELRSLMDWIWTDTSMNISNWLKMEDIYANIFVLKCTRRAEADYPTPRGAKRTALIKYGVGGFLLFFIILIIWFPLLLFALGNTVGRTNPPISCTVELSITGYEPIFRTTALKHQIHSFTSNQWNQLEREVANLADPSTTSFLTGYDKDDTVIVELSNNSTSVWTISPPSQNALIEELRGTNELKMVLSWSFLRERETQATEPEVKDEIELNLNDTELRRSLADALSVNSGNSTTIHGASPESTTIKDIFPNYVKIPGKGTASVVKQFYNKETQKGKEFFGASPFRSLNISMWTGAMLNATAMPNSSVARYIEWWEVQDDCSHGKPYRLEGIDNCNFLRLIAFSDKAFPSELSIISGYGIVGLYTTFVLVVSRLVRGFVAGTSFTIMFDDMPYVDRVLQLCLDIYLVRESGEFTLEEDLFAKLIFLYRSPEMLIKWTRPPELEPEVGRDERQLPGVQR